MTKDYKKIFNGMLLIMLDFNIGFVDILPDFIGYFMIAIGAVQLYEKTQNKAFKISNYLAGFMGMVTLMTLFIPNYNGLDKSYVPEYVFIVNTVFMLLNIYIYDGLFIGSLALKKDFFNQEGEKVKAICNAKTVREANNIDNFTDRHQQLKEEIKSLQVGRKVYLIFMLVAAFINALGPIIGVNDYTWVWIIHIILSVSATLIALVQINRMKKNCEKYDKHKENIAQNSDLMI